MLLKVTLEYMKFRDNPILGLLQLSF